MQSARQHTRFFRLVYYSPKQSDILCGIDVRIHIATAMIALERLVASYTDMVAFVTSLRSIFRLNYNQLHTGKSALVSKEFPKLAEIPRVEFCPEGLVSPLGCPADMLQVLNGYANASLLGFGNNTLGNSVVDYRCGSSFSPFKPFQESGTSTLALSCSASCAFGLNGTTYHSLSFPVSVECVRRIGLTFGRAYNIGYSEIKSDELLNVFHIFFRNFNRLEKEEFAFFENKVSFPLDVWKIVCVVAYKRNTLSFPYGPDRNRIFGIRQYPAVVTDAAKFPEVPFGFLVKLVSICHLADTADHHLCRQIKILSDFIVAMMMYIELSKNLILPHHIGYAVTRSIRLLDGIKKQPALSFAWKEFYFQCQFHASNVNHLFEKDNSILVLILKRAGRNSSHKLKICGFPCTINMKNSEFVSRIINDMNSINKDAHVSRRWILSIGRQKARSYIAQKYADGTLFGEESLYTHINCMEMERVRKIDCCFDEFKLCRILMRSKKRLPDMIYTRIGPAIIKVSNIMDDIMFTSISLRKYANNKERKYWNIDQYYYYVNDGYIYIPDINIEAINVDLITLDRKAALELSGCGAEKDKPCTSQWDYDFICPDKLLEYVVSETLRETITKLQIPTDENPDMDINKKTQKIQ